MKQFQIVYSLNDGEQESALVKAKTRKEARAYIWDSFTKSEQDNKAEIISVEEIK